jgi:hypothetical protein
MDTVKEKARETKAKATESTAVAVKHAANPNFAPAGTLAFSVTANVTHFHFLTVTGISLPNNNPFNVIATVRAPGNNNPGFSDSYALTVNQINTNSVIFKVWRVDSSDNPAASIRIDFFVVL